MALYPNETWPPSYIPPLTMTLPSATDGRPDVTKDGTDRHHQQSPQLPLIGISNGSGLTVQQKSIIIGTVLSVCLIGILTSLAILAHRLSKRNKNVANSGFAEPDPAASRTSASSENDLNQSAKDRGRSRSVVANTATNF